MVDGDTMSETWREWRTLGRRCKMSVSMDGDGVVQAVYIRVRRKKVVWSEEIVSDNMIADYDGRERLVGIEILRGADECERCLTT